MRYTKKLLDKRICDVEKNCDITKTYREWLEDLSEQIIGIKLNFDSMNDDELNNAVDELIWLSYK
jgi:hypothetical protein